MSLLHVVCVFFEAFFLWGILFCLTLVFIFCARILFEQVAEDTVLFYDDVAMAKRYY